MSAEYETTIRAAAEAFADAIIGAVRAELARQVPSGPLPERLFSIDEAAAALHVARSTLYQLIGAGELGTIKVGRRRLVPASRIAGFTAASGAGHDDGRRVTDPDRGGRVGGRDGFAAPTA